MALFEGYERRIAQIDSFLAANGIESLEKAEKICLDKGVDVRKIVKSIQPIAFENAGWAYLLGAAAAITRKQNSVIVHDRGINGLARSCFEESRRVGMISGHLDPDDVGFADVEEVAMATAANHSSMLQDVDRGRRTEIDSINGEIVRIGSEVGLDVRMNGMLVSLVSAMTRGPDASNVF